MLVIAPARLSVTLWEVNCSGVPVADQGCRLSLTAVDPLLGGFTGFRFSRKAQRFLQLLLIDNRAGKCSLDHPQGTEHEIRLVEIRISAAFGRTVFIDAAEIIFQERAGSGSSSPRIFTAGFRALSKPPARPRTARYHKFTAIGTTRLNRWIV